MGHVKLIGYSSTANSIFDPVKKPAYLTAIYKNSFCCSALTRYAWFIQIFINNIPWLFNDFPTKYFDLFRSDTQHILAFLELHRDLKAPDPLFAAPRLQRSQWSCKKRVCGFQLWKFWDKFVQFGAFGCNQKYKLIKIIFL